MSGPFVDETNYPWDSIRKMPVFMTEGTGATPSLVGSKAMLAWMKERGFKIEYMEVNADHGGMIPLVLPSVFPSSAVQIRDRLEGIQYRSIHIDMVYSLCGIRVGFVQESI